MFRGRYSISCLQVAADVWMTTQPIGQGIIWIGNVTVALNWIPIITNSKSAGQSESVMEVEDPRSSLLH